MDIPIYRVGGLVRIDRVDPRDNHGLAVGQVVTIVSVHQDATGESWVVVAPGNIGVYLRDTSPVATHDELHPEDTMPDDDVNERFDAMADLLLHDWYGKTIDELAAELSQGEDGPIEDCRTPSTTNGAPAQHGDVAVIDPPTTAQQTPRNGPTTPYVPDPREDLFAYVDHDGDRIQFIYYERYPDGGMVALVRVMINGQMACDLPIGTLVGLARFFGFATNKFTRRSRERRNGS